MKNTKRIIALMLCLMMMIGLIPNGVVVASGPNTIEIDFNLENGSVYCSKLDPSSNEDVYLSCIPKGGYELDKFYVIKDGVSQDLDSNCVEKTLHNGDAITVGARFKKANEIDLQPETIKRLNRIAQVLEMNEEETEEFRAFFATTIYKEMSSFDNAFYFTFKLLEPLAVELYDKSYLIKHRGWMNDDTFDSFVITNYNEFYIKEITGLLLFSYVNELEYVTKNAESHLTCSYVHNAYCYFLSKLYDKTSQQPMKLENEFREVLNWEFLVYDDYLSNVTISISPDTLISEFNEQETPIYRMIQSMQRMQIMHDWGAVYYGDELDKVDMWLAGLLSVCIQGPSDDENSRKYFILNDEVSVEAFDEWINEKEDFDTFLNKVKNKFDYLKDLKDSVSTLEGFEKTKAQWKIMNKLALELYALYESVFYAGSEDAVLGMLSYDFGDNIMTMIDNLEKDRTGALFNYDTLFSDFLDSYETLLNDFNGQVWSGGDADVSTVKDYFNNLKEELYELNKPVITPSHSSKTYKANNTDKTAEKIAGSGKKGSKRTITPLEGKKVGKVTVTDKDGNKVEVTPNADGTYSFIQPASNVTVEVTYVNREITLTIGSTEADVDGERSNLDVCPVIRNDRTMLPIRFIAENLGAKVEWSEKNPNYVVIEKDDIKIEITLGSDTMKVNGKDVKLDSVAFAENDRTYLPVRAISENLNAVVEWNEERPMEVKIYER